MPAMSDGPRRRIRAITYRRLTQTVFLVLFVVLFFLTRRGVNSVVPVDLFLRADPLVGLSVMLATRTVIVDLLAFGLVTVALTLLLRRVFCGWICPLGAIIDGCDHILYRGRHRRHIPDMHQVKYAVLIAVLVSALFAGQFLIALDPIVLLERTAATVFLPIGVQVYNVVVTEAYPLLQKVGIELYPTDHLVYASNLVTLAIFVTIIALSSLQKRFWCRNICPLGALLAVLSWRPVLKKRVSAACTECNICVRNCKMGAIDKGGKPTNIRECIECMNCVAVCPEGAVSYGLAGQPEQTTREISITRRQAIQAAGLALAWAAVAHTEGMAVRKSNRLIRPPGALPEPEFVQTCVRCGACMKACITHGLQPATWQAGLEGIWTPVLVPRIGYCEKNCTACGDVCPTNALRPFTVQDKEKPEMALGVASINRDRCIAWYANKKCGACNEACPYKAVQLVDARGLDGSIMRRPFVDETICTGCGMCENVCPVKPDAAIVVQRRSHVRRYRHRLRQRGKPEAAIVVQRRENESALAVPWGNVQV